jgi:hypothetical protein
MTEPAADPHKDSVHHDTAKRHRLSASHPLPNVEVHDPHAWSLTLISYHSAMHIPMQVLVAPDAPFGATNTSRLGNSIQRQPPSSASTSCTRIRHAIRVTCGSACLTTRFYPTPLHVVTTRHPGPGAHHLHKRCTLPPSISRLRTHVSVCHRRAASPRSGPVTREAIE